MIVRWLVQLIVGYQRFLSPFKPTCCRFYPSCSEYAKQVLSAHGLFKGLFKALWRLLRCHPFHPGGYDPIH